MSVELFLFFMLFGAVTWLELDLVSSTSQVTRWKDRVFATQSDWLQGLSPKYPIMC